MSLVDELLNRPLETGGTPLMHFRGRLKSASAVEAGKSHRLVFDFTDVEVIATRGEPYPFVTAQISIPYSPREDTYYAPFKKSITRVTGGAPVVISDLEGRMQEWKRLPAKVRLPRRDESGNNVKDENGKDIWELQNADCWNVLSIEGYETEEQSGNDMKELAALADGKTEQEFHTAVMQDARFKSKGDIVGAVIGRTLIPTLVAIGLVDNSGDKLVVK